MISRIYRFFAQSIRNRILLAMLVVSFPALLGMSAYSIFVSRNLVITNTVSRQEDRIAAQSQEIKHFLSGVREDVLYLSRSHAVRQMVISDLLGEEAAYTTARQVVEQEFLNFSQVKGIYYQVRFIDALGMEVVRVDSDGANVFVVPRDQLQNKAGRYYFDDTIRLPLGEVMVSPLDLNVERGEIERPFRPVIRYATPVWFGDYVAGMVIVNVFAERFLDVLGAQADAGEIIALVDETGYYLYHSTNVDKQWGRDLRTGITVFQDYPQMVELISDAADAPQSGALQTGQDLLFFSRFSPPGTTAYQWVLLSIRPYRLVIAPVLQFEWVMLGGILLAFGGVAGIGYWSSATLVRPIEELGRQAMQMGKGNLDTPIGARAGGAWFRQDEVGRLAQTFDQTRVALRQARTELEGQIQRLSRRTLQLQTATEVSRAAVAILDPQRLLSDVVHLISARFGFYHSGIFLLDESREWLILRSASSRGGQRLLSYGYRVRIAQAGVVGQAVVAGVPRIAAVEVEDSWLPTRVDLPDTRAEIALPLKYQERVIGVLDVHSVLEGAFIEDDVTILQTLADQLALTLHNNQLFQESQERYAAMLRAQGEYSRQAWVELARTLVGGGYRYHEQTLSQAGDFWQPEMTTALKRGETTLADGAPEAVALPLRVRDQIIGVVDARKPDGTLWTSEELALLETVRGRLEVALESARFYRDSQRSAAREQLLREITEQVRSAVDVESVMRTAVLEIGRTLGREVFVYLVDQPDKPTALEASESGGEE